MTTTDCGFQPWKVYNFIVFLQIELSAETIFELTHDHLITIVYL